MSPLQVYRPTARQLQRQRHLAKACDTLKLSGMVPVVRNTEMYVDDQLRYVHDLVLKAACTTWRCVLLRLYSKTRNFTFPTSIENFVTDLKISDKYLPRLSTFSDDEQQFRLRNYFKFVFFREPLNRLVSAYQDKFGNRNNAFFERIYGVHIVKTYRRNATSEALTSGRGVTFEEFIQYLVDQVKKRKALDFHWKPQHIVSQPCSVRYDYIGKFEIIHEDVNEVLQIIGGSGLVEFPSRSDSGYKKPIFGNKTLELFTRIPKGSAEILLQLYELDYKLLLNYEVPMFESLPDAK